MQEQEQAEDVDLWIAKPGTPLGSPEWKKIGTAGRFHAMGFEEHIPKDGSAVTLSAKFDGQVTTFMVKRGHVPLPEWDEAAYAAKIAEEKRFYGKTRDGSAQSGCKKRDKAKKAMEKASRKRNRK